MGCGTKCLKFSLFFFNFLFLLAGAALVGISVWILVDQGSFARLVGEVPFSLAAVYVILGAGVALVVISFFGCCGAAKANACMLTTFFILLLIVFLAEIVGAILVFVYSSQITTEITNSMNAYNATSNTDITKAWDAVQTVVNCCGLKGYQDWQNKTWESRDPTNTAILFPASCCVDAGNFPTCNSQDSNTALFHPTGCEQQFNTLIYIIGGVGLGILLLELIGMVLTCILGRKVKDSSYQA